MPITSIGGDSVQEEFCKYKIIMRIKSNNGFSFNTVNFLTERIKSSLTIAERLKNLVCDERLTELSEYEAGFIYQFRALIRYAFKEECDAVNSGVIKREYANVMNWLPKFYSMENISVENVHRLLSVLNMKAEKIKNDVVINSSGRDFRHYQREFTNYFEYISSVKLCLTRLEKFVRELTIDMWSIPANGFGDRYLLVNAAEKVSDGLKRSPTISASVLDLQNPHWYLDDRRFVLFVYSPKKCCDNTLGMFESDSSTFYRAPSNIGVDNDILAQLLMDTSVSNVWFDCNSTGFRPVYFLDEFNYDKPQEIVLNGNTRPVGIVLASDNQKNLLDAKAYKTLFPEVSIWKLKDGKLQQVD